MYLVVKSKGGYKLASQNNNNRIEVPAARSLLEQLKYETAAELGIPDYDKVDKGELPARVHGKIGGNMVKKMIAFAEETMNNPQNMKNIQNNDLATNKVDPSIQQKVQQEAEQRQH